MMSLCEGLNSGVDWLVNIVVCRTERGCQLMSDIKRKSLYLKENFSVQIKTKGCQGAKIVSINAMGPGIIQLSTGQKFTENS